MRRSFDKFGFSLVEMTVVVAVILILAGALLGVGKYVKIRAEIDLTKSELEVLTTALQQYYDDFGEFPFFTADDTDAEVTDDNSNGKLDEYIGDYTPVQGSIPNDDYDFDSSTALFYFLDTNPNSRKIVDSLMDSLITNKDADGIALKISINGDSDIDLPRFVDAWGMSIRYEYIDGTAFPILTSAGPDKEFNTPDDVVN